VFNRLEDIGFYLAAAVILVEQRQNFPTLIRVFQELSAHGTHERLGRAITVRQGVEPLHICACTARQRLRPAGGFYSGAHNNVLISTNP
jgi:hypothetical protein